MTGNERTWVIMVVDDDESNREVLRLLLSGVGYRVIEASNGAEAVVATKREHCDLVIMDLAMPTMDGFGALRLLTELIEMKGVPIFACTAYDTPSHRLQALQAGFDEFVTKPINFLRLQTLIKGYLSDNPADLHRNEM